MGRAIEFRAWNKYHKKMHSVYEINFDHSISKTRDDKTGQTYTFGFIDLELMQFTGLHDKNGVKIFEGDIVSWGENIESVSFNDCMFQTETSCIDSCMTVIGNIHQNPELLEKK